MIKSISFILILLSLLTLISLVSCNGTEPVDTTPEVIYHTVSFSTGGGSEVGAVRVLDGGNASRPKNPTRDGYIFDHWSFEGKEWNFDSDRVTESITLIANWIDAATVYSYTTVDGGICITGIKRSFESMEIPSVINGIKVVALGDELFLNTVPENVSRITVAETVTQVGEKTFANCKDIEIVINSALTSIGSEAFKSCTDLKEIKLGVGIEQIPPIAFSGCTSLEKIVIPDSVITIDENAFEDCMSLTSVTLSSSVASINDSAFLGCDKLKNVYFNGTEEQFKAISIAQGNNAFKQARLTVNI